MVPPLAEPVVPDEEGQGRRAYRLSRAQVTARDIGLAIIRGHYRPDERLPVEADLMERFGVSRNVLREAIKTLTAKGLVRTVRRAGTTVQARARWNLLDPDVLQWTVASSAQRPPLLRQLTELRAMLEPEVAALAAQQATTTQALRLQEAFEAMCQAQDEPKKAIEADIAFHCRLIEAAGNELLTSLLPALVTLLKANFEFTMHTDGGFQRNLGLHGEVAEAVLGGDPEAARQAMRRLLSNNEQDLAALMSAAGDPL